MPTVLVTERSGARAHHVDEVQLTGALLAVCGTVFIPAALCAPDGRPCVLCRETLRARARSRAPRPVPGTRSGLGRLLAP